MIRPGTPDDAAALTALARAAKASWGYPDAWLREWEPQLTITREYLTTQTVFVAETAGGIVGMIGVETGADGPEIGHLWVSSTHQGEGWGRRLVEAAVAVATQRQWPALRILSDPHAVAFYTRLGAVHVANEPAPVAGVERTLPVLRLPIGAPPR